MENQQAMNEKLLREVEVGKRSEIILNLYQQIQQLQNEYKDLEEKYNTLLESIKEE